MPFLSANGVGAIRANLVRPRVGAWHAELTLDATTLDAFQGPVTIVLADQMTFQGDARRQGVHHDAVFMRVVGGAGGLASQVPARSWVNVPLRIPLLDALGAVGETLSSSADATTLGTLLPKWSRPQRGAGQEIGALVAAVPGAVWRVLPDGTIWVGPETWPVSAFEFDELEHEPALGRLELGSDLPTIAPGQTISAPGEVYDGARVSTVEHVVEGGRIRHFLYLEDAGAPSATDRLKAGLSSIVQSFVGSRLDALALYPAKVISQNGDGTLEVRPDDTRWPDYSGVPYRTLPGLTFTVPAGSRVLLGFAGGDPRKPIAELWEPASGTTFSVSTTGMVSVNAGGIPAAQPVARAVLDHAGPWPIVGGNLFFKA